SKLVDAPAVITVGKISSGARFNIIPETAEMVGTVRTLDPEMKKMILRRMNEMVPAIAQAYGGTATLEVRNNTSITYNDIELTSRQPPTLQKVAGIQNVKLMKPSTGGEDFSFYQEESPWLYFFVGGEPAGSKESVQDHTPDFSIGESGMSL